MSWFESFMKAAAAAALLLAPSLHAQECADAVDCPAGYTCTASAPACPPCPIDAGDCPCDITATSFCELAPSSCVADEDCEDGLVCVHFTGASCPGVGCASSDGSPCDAGPPPECETIDEQQCAPPWIAACSVDADCGPGFTCEAQDVCSCTVWPEPSDQTAPPPSECSCTPTDERSCALQVVVCDDDDDCAAGLVCAQGPACLAPCMVGPDGGTDCPCSATSAICAPPGYIGGLPLAENGGVTAQRASMDEGDGGTSDAGGGTGDAGGGCGGCAATDAAGIAPLAALALLLRRPGRRARRIA